MTEKTKDPINRRFFFCLWDLSSFFRFPVILSRGSGEESREQNSKRNHTGSFIASLFRMTVCFEGELFYSGDFLICAQRRGNLAGVSATLRIMRALWVTSVPGMV